MTMIKTSKHNITNITNNIKLKQLDMLFDDYKKHLEIYINYIIDGILPLKNNLSSKLLSDETLKHSRYKQLIYKQASEIIRSQIKKANQKRYYHYKKIYSYMIENHPNNKFVNKKYSELNLKDIYKSKYFTIPNLNNISINLDERFFDIKQSNHFNNFIKIILPYFNEKGTRANKINIPLKQHKHSNKLKENGYNLKNNIQIKKINNNYYINLIWFKEEPKKRTEGSSLGIDIGINKLITTSDNQIIGRELKKIYYKIINKKKKSKAYYKALNERTSLINYYIKQLNLNNINNLYVEDLKNVKYKSSYKQRKKNNKKYLRKDIQTKNNNVNASWLYPLVINKLTDICDEQGINLVKVSPAYTSQMCSNCGHIDKKSRNGENYKCASCGYEDDADVNASINIRNGGAYGLSD